MDLHPDWSEFLRLLNSHGVEYLVVGAHALAYHGHPRMTSDLDCFVSNEASNVERLDLALREFGFDMGIPDREAFLTMPRVLMMGRLPFRIDLLNEIDGVSFAAAWSNRVSGEMGGIPVFFISRGDLLQNKRASARAKDLADIESLTSPESSQ